MKNVSHSALAQQPMTEAGALGLQARELADFQDEPPQMASGAIGKNAYLRLGFERRGDQPAGGRLGNRYRFPALPEDNRCPLGGWKQFAHGCRPLVALRKP
mgnify:CR=1 FL=1